MAGSTAETAPASTKSMRLFMIEVLL